MWYITNSSGEVELSEIKEIKPEDYEMRDELLIPSFNSSGEIEIKLNLEDKDGMLNSTYDAIHKVAYEEWKGWS